MNRPVEWQRIKRGGVWGPWHIVTGRLSLCGSKMTGFNKERTWLDDEEPTDRRCAACLRHKADGTRRVWRGR